MTQLVAGEDRGEGDSSHFLLLILLVLLLFSQMMEGGSDGAVMEAECHNNIGRTGTRGDGGEAQERSRPKGPSCESEGAAWRRGLSHRTSILMCKRSEQKEQEATRKHATSVDVRQIELHPCAEWGSFSCCCVRLQLVKRKGAGVHASVVIFI